MIYQYENQEYLCPACHVQGVGDACWYCGMTKGLKRRDLSRPTHAHRHDPNRPTVPVSGKAWRIEESVDHVVQR